MREIGAKIIEIGNCMIELGKMLDGEEDEFELPDPIEALEFRRDMMGLSKCDFAEKLSIGKSHYSEITHKKREIPKHVMKTAVSLGVPAEVFLGRSGMSEEVEG